MKYIIAYDIESSKIRSEFSNFLISENFIRIQKSVFIGNINKKFLYMKIQKWILNIINDKDSILICPLCQNDIQKSYFIGQTFEKMDMEIFENFIFC